MDIMVSEALEPAIQDVSIINGTYDKGTARSTNRDYFKCVYNSFSEEYVQYFHPGFNHKEIRDRFENWWWSCIEPADKRLHKTRTTYSFPKSIGEALDRASNELRVPDIIKVDMNSHFRNIEGVEFKL